MSIYVHLLIFLVYFFFIFLVKLGFQCVVVFRFQKI